MYHLIVQQLCRAFSRNIGPEIGICLARCWANHAKTTLSINCRLSPLSLRLTPLVSSSVNVFRWDIITFPAFWELKVRKVRLIEQTRHIINTVKLSLFSSWFSADSTRRAIPFFFLVFIIRDYQSYTMCLIVFLINFLLISVTFHFREVFYTNGTCFLLLNTNMSNFNKNDSIKENIWGR